MMIGRQRLYRTREPQGAAFTIGGRAKSLGCEPRSNCYHLRVPPRPVDGTSASARRFSVNSLTARF
jgi:hypothetical protein